MIKHLYIEVFIDVSFYVSPGYLGNWIIIERYFDHTCYETHKMYTSSILVLHKYQFEIQYNQFNKRDAWWKAINIDNECLYIKK